MSAITSRPARSETAAGGFIHAAMSAMSRWWLAYTAWRIERLTIARLKGMSDRQLQDMGIMRSQIEHACRQGAERDSLAGPCL